MVVEEETYRDIEITEIERKGCGFILYIYKWVLVLTFRRENQKNGNETRRKTT